MGLEPEEVRAMREKGEKISGSGELDFQEGGLSAERQDMTAEIVERGPMVSGTNPLARERNAPRVVIEDPDRDLIVRWQAGDEAAFEELIRKHESRVYRLLYRMMGSKEDAEDLTQETFLSLHRYGHRAWHRCRRSRRRLERVGTLAFGRPPRGQPVRLHRIGVG